MYEKDKRLPIEDRIELILSIEYWQEKRWVRLKKFHNIQGISMDVRHFFMQQTINLIREQKRRLLELRNFTFK